MKLQCLKLFIMTKKKFFWRISVKFHLWVPLIAHLYPEIKSGNSLVHDVET